MKLNANSSEEFLKQFHLFLDSDKAKNCKSIIYIWRTERPFNRINGCSPIIYIGRTINTFRKRYKNKSSLSIEKRYFERYYKFMIHKYGAISIEIIETKKPKYKEWEALMSYNQEYKEYPPLNRSIPSEPKFS